MIRKVLIANRGEIAVRVIRACRELGIATVAVYSDPDREALHVRMADEAYHIGPAPARESYLRVDKLIDVAKRSGADAIHPGYGFLSEKEVLPRACAEAGITFIGPSAEAMAAMGEKTAARRRMHAAGVPIVPGALEGVTAEEAARIAKEIGFPVILKAAAGGGGKGVRVVERAEDLPSALRAAASEAESSFGDPTVYVERYVSPARHIEIQIIADTHGNCVYLGERECSIQRRLQKLVEESPSVIMDPDLRRRMGEAAVAAARAVGYVNAGTIEFLVDADRNFYFMEMNTRLQVEHPVTELVTGIDLVHEQIRVASGLPLSFSQEDIRPRGHAIECRISAEDPFNNFLPAIGTIEALREPLGPGVRVDSALYEGLHVTVDYDPLLSKLIVWAPTREEAIRRMRRALEEYHIVGVRTTIPFHQILMESADFAEGRFDTAFISRRWPALASEIPARAEEAALLAMAVAHAHGHQAKKPAPPSNGRISPWKLLARRDGLRRL
ncbi:MAG: acetyl-CoA carboxylase biotin carboxylase subunit [Chloroflexota bacterium]|nr:acetyl-CoA carboxylase biotin carboxylase subunit [Dehalococcoidia bacterium]MDW8253696.1 acetyl-CoA carboxylase biotin carboxylase subunit [Chloroflexota bacterium]